MDGETIFAILAGVALAVFSLAMVGYAFFRGNASSEEAPLPPQSPGPASVQGTGGVGLESIYDSIDTLELEYQLGNLPEEQYREQLQAYRLEAAAVIKAQLEQGAAPPELLLEQEVMAARAELRSPELADKWQPCPDCDAPIPASLGLSKGLCPHCGAIVSVERAGGETVLRQAQDKRPPTSSEAAQEQ